MHNVSANAFAPNGAWFLFGATVAIKHLAPNGTKLPGDLPHLKRQSREGSAA